MRFLSLFNSSRHQVNLSRHPVLALFTATIIALSSHSSYASRSAVILQYHHVSTDTPASTSVTPAQLKAHIEWLKENKFQVLPLEDIIQTLKTKQKFTHNRVVAVSFDDANLSVCDTAWPILKKFNIPFTLFINTHPIEAGYTSQCTWAQLKTMSDSGLMTPANHSHNHLNMLKGYTPENNSTWAEKMQSEIQVAQQIITNKLMRSSRLFAYPYGEYNSALAKIITEQKFIGFGQHSGAIGYDSDFSALPRIPASGQFANLKTLAVKLLSLPFPVEALPSVENPISEKDNKNPPMLTLRASDKNSLLNTQCFNGKGEALHIDYADKHLNVTQENKLSSGRHRYTCTKKSELAGRYFWISHQWLIE